MEESFEQVALAMFNYMVEIYNVEPKEQKEIEVSGMPLNRNTRIEEIIEFFQAMI